MPQTAAAIKSVRPCSRAATPMAIFQTNSAGTLRGKINRTRSKPAKGGSP